MAAANVNKPEDCYELTSYSNPFMSLTATETQVEFKMDNVNERNKVFGRFNPFICDNEPSRPRFSSTNPFAQD